MTNEADTATEHLTQRQIECLVLVHQHRTSKEIGIRLGISPHTVDQHIRSAMRTFGCKNRFHAADLVAVRPPAAVFPWDSACADPFVEDAVTSRFSKSVTQPRRIAYWPSRLLWSLGIACGSAFSLVVYLAGLESLARLFQQT